MPKIIVSAVFFILSFFLYAQNNAKPFGIVIHGGAGNIEKSKLSEERQAEYQAKLNEALLRGYAVLEAGGSSGDAVEAAIVILENSPLFNAGKGAVFTNSERNELDASFMDGKTLNAGAIAGVSRIKNPVKAARAVMLQSEHVMLSGVGAENFAQSVGLEMVDPEYFKDSTRLKQLRAIKAKEEKRLNDNQSVPQNEIISADTYPDEKFGTVGAVALDKAGNLSASTSTGGMTNKRYGRIGDAPIIAAGTYADNKSCAVSCTGHGEFFIRKVVAYDVAAQMKYAGIPILEAAQNSIYETAQLGGKGGLIAIDAQGNIATPFSTSGMFRGWKLSNGKTDVKMFGVAE